MATFSGNMDGLPLASTQEHTPSTASPAKKWQPESPFSLLGKSSCSQAAPAFLNQLFWQGRNPSARPASKRSCRAVAGKTDQVTHNPKGQTHLEVSRPKQKAFVGVPGAYSQSTPAHTSCLPCQGYPDKMIKLCWSTLVQHRMSQQHHYFNFLCHSCTPRGGRGAKGTGREKGCCFTCSPGCSITSKSLCYLISPQCLSSNIRRAQGWKKTLLLDCCSVTQYLITLCLSFLGHPTVFSFYWDPDQRHYKKPAASAGFARNSQIAKRQA